MAEVSAATRVVKGAFIAAFLSVAEAAISDKITAWARGRGMLPPLPSGPDTLDILPLVMSAASTLSSFGFGVLLLNLSIFALFVPLDLRKRRGKSSLKSLVIRLIAVTLLLAGTVLSLSSQTSLALTRVAVLVVGTGAVYAWWWRRMSSE